MFSKKMDQLKLLLEAMKIDLAIITDQDNIYYLTGYYDYLHMDFGRPTILIIHNQSNTILITPAIDANSAQALAKVDRIEAWNDGAGNEWREELPYFVKKANKIAIEKDNIPSLILAYLAQIIDSTLLLDATPLLSRIRMIKSPEELQIARHAGQVANAMMSAGRETIRDGVAEYEVALAIAEAGTKKAAELLTKYYQDKDMSPNTHFLQIMASGNTITKTHHRASTKIIRYGEPVFLCFCGMTNFHRFKLGFDRTFWLGEIIDPLQEKIYNVALTSQEAALNAITPGVTAESVHKEYAKIISDNGYDYPFRCGRATGFSFLEKPQLVTGDKTILKPGMVLAIDGSVTVDNFRAQVGDSIIITKEGYEIITHHPKKLTEVII